MSICLVTGVAGFLGSHIAEYLLKDGHVVVGFDDLSTGFIENIPRGVIFYEASMVNSEFIENLFITHSFDYVYHIAAMASEGLSHFVRHFNYYNNLVGSANLINCAIKYEAKCFVFTSSMSVYGSQCPPFTENMPYQPEDPYAISKVAVEQDLKAAYDLFGLNYIIFRPHNIIGTRQNLWDANRNVAAIFLNQILNGLPMTVFGSGEQVRAFSDVRDVAPVIATSIFIEKAYRKVFNIGGNTPITINQLTQIVARSLDVACKTVHLPERYEVKYAYSDHSVLDEVFGKRTTISPENGIAVMADWAKDVYKRREVKYFTDIEIYKNIPEKWIKPDF